jgi:hypothetical protein
MGVVGWRTSVLCRDGVVLMQEVLERRSTRRDKGIRLLTPRDRWVLPWIAEQYAVRFDHLRLLLSRNLRTVSGRQSVTPSGVRQVLRRWTRAPEWAEYQRIYTDTPGWIWLTPVGMQLFDLPYARHVIRESTLEHLHGINGVRLDIERRHPEYRWISERAMRAQFPRREEGERVGHTPDAQIWTPEGRRIAVEVELSWKREEEMDTILQLLLRDYHTVWYFVGQANPAQVRARRAVEKAQQRLPEELRPRVQVIALESISL